MANSAPQHHSDNAFPYVLIISTVGTILSLGTVLVTALPIA